ncbi:phage holin [Uliginosibacterium gangwonense]|uniref:phage holin n=1 Tax=Uliginosibacterium gangwonense TaxID=392736 RepID=UPI00037E2936|nr:phage holin [Uliginosibacterium gangwonense]
MTTSNTTLASYGTSVFLTLKGLYQSASDAWAGMPLESKIGVALGVGTFAINWYYKRRRDQREVVALTSGRLVEIVTGTGKGISDDD